MIRLAGLALGLALGPLPAAAGEGTLEFLRRAAVAACEAADPAKPEGALEGAALIEDAPIRRGGREMGRRLRFRLASGGEAEVSRFAPGGTLRRLDVAFFAAAEDGGARPLAMVAADPACRILFGRRIDYDDEGQAREIALLGHDLAETGQTEPLNPAVPAGADPGGVAVALVDSGLNYTLPAFAGRLARDARGTILGYDFWEMDARPFDAHPTASPFFPARHGTAVASVLVAEAPGARLVPLRYPRPEMNRMVDLVARAGAAGARVVAVPMGSADAGEWAAFVAAARVRPGLLFVLSAGNDGRDIDTAPIYPAAAGIENALVVTSSDATGRLGRGSNWGARRVDLMVPAERVAVVDFLGRVGTAAGSSFAVPRLAALAARLAAAHPDWDAAALKAAILARARPVPGEDAAVVRYGWIPDPDKD